MYEDIPDLKLPDKGQGRASKDYVALINNDVEVVQKYLPGLRRNQLTSSLEYNAPDGRTLILQGNDLDTMTTKFVVEFSVYIPRDRMTCAVQYAADQNRYCPIRNYLTRCEKESQPSSHWNCIGKEFLGNESPTATQAIQRLMIGAVNRAFNPGASMQWLPILVGAQGVGKSMFARNLVPQDLFAEITTPLDKLSTEPNRLHVAWIIELPEIDAYFQVRNIENFKNLVTTRIDETRLAYDRLPSKLARRFVLIGTTNRNQFLVDSTGNRRFVPIEIGNGFRIPWKQLIEERDSLWSAAVRDWKAGCSYEFTSGEIADLSEYIQEFGDPDPWQHKIAEYVDRMDEVKVSQILEHGLQLDYKQQGRKESRRVTEVMQSLGWRRINTTREGKSVRLWKRTSPLPILEKENTDNSFDF
jgi:predicted P-loop ATPase